VTLAADFYGIPVGYEGVGPEWLYTLHGEDEPLYIGITKRGRQRFIEHRNQRWWGEVRRISVLRFATRAEAREAERNMIGATATPHNHADRGTRDEVRKLQGQV